MIFLVFLCLFKTNLIFNLSYGTLLKELFSIILAEHVLDFSSYVNVKKMFVCWFLLLYLYF